MDCVCTGGGEWLDFQSRASITHWIKPIMGLYTTRNMCARPCVINIYVCGLRDMSVVHIKEVCSGDSDDDDGRTAISSPAVSRRKQ